MEKEQASRNEAPSSMENLSTNESQTPSKGNHGSTSVSAPAAPPENTEQARSQSDIPRKVYPVPSNTPPPPAAAAAKLSSIEKQSASASRLAHSGEQQTPVRTHGAQGNTHEAHEARPSSVIAAQGTASLPPKPDFHAAAAARPNFCYDDIHYPNGIDQPPVVNRYYSLSQNPYPPQNSHRLSPPQQNTGIGNEKACGPAHFPPGSAEANYNKPPKPVPPPHFGDHHPMTGQTCVSPYPADRPQPAGAPSTVQSAPVPGISYPVEGVGYGISENPGRHRTGSESEVSGESRADVDGETVQTTDMPARKIGRVEHGHGNLKRDGGFEVENGANLRTE